MKTKLIALLIISIIFTSEIISQNIFSKNTKDKISDPIELKTKNCEIYKGLFTMYQSKKMVNHTLKLILIILIKSLFILVILKMELLMQVL